MHRFLDLLKYKIIINQSLDIHGFSIHSRASHGKKKSLTKTHFKKDIENCCSKLSPERTLYLKAGTVCSSWENSTTMW